MSNKESYLPGCWTATGQGYGNSQIAGLVAGDPVLGIPLPARDYWTYYQCYT